VDSGAPPITERISGWVTSLTGSSDEPQNGHAAKSKEPPVAARPRTPRSTDAARTRRRSDSRATAERDSPSWVLRAAAVMLLALLMLALVVIVMSVV
jgi:hypothetical protein